MEPTEDISWHIAETPEDQEICFRLRSTGYRRYYRHIPRKRYADELDYEQLPDGSPRSLTILVTERGKPVGTARASLVRSSEYPFLHAAIDELFDVPHELLQELGAPGQGSGLGELSRLTIYGTRRAARVIHTMAAGYAEAAKLLGIDAYVMMMNRSSFPKMLKKLGVPIHELPQFSLRRDDIDSLLYMVRYFDYFFPNLNTVLPDVEEDSFVKHSRMTLFELRSIIDGLYPRDPVSLYWITPQELAEASTQTESGSRYARSH